MRTAIRGRAIWTTAAIGGLTAAAGSAVAQSTDDVLIHGYIYDFHADHPDFGLSAGSGLEVTGLVDTVLGSDGVPVFMGGGTGLGMQALDRDGKPIAPHLYAAFGSGGPLVLESSPSQQNSSVLDSFDPSLPYDPSTAVAVSSVSVTPSIPDLTAPVFDPPVAKVSEMFFEKKKVITILKGNHHTDQFKVLQGHTLSVDGDVHVRVDQNLEIRNLSKVVIPPGSSLTFWIGGDCYIENHCDVNVDSGDYTALVINNFGTTDIYLQNNTEIHGTIVSPNAKVHAENSTGFFGALTAEGLVMQNSSGVHLAGEVPTPSACYAEGDTQEASGSPSAGQISGASSFGQWFASAPGINDFDRHQLFLHATGPDTYEMSTPEWDPINGALYGNEGDIANRGFTFAGESQFISADCADQFFEVETAMDCWAFIDDELVIDLGGNTGMSSQRIQTDRLKLDPGPHKLRVFIAQRQDGPDGLRITTSLGLTPPRGANYRASAHHD